MKTNVKKQNNAVVLFIYLLAFVLMTWSYQAKAKTTKSATNPEIVISTSEGDIKVKLNSEKAPISVENFLKYVNKKHYDGTTFHRVIKTFMVQGGGHLPDMTEKPTEFPQIKNEATNGLSNMRGTISMARMNEKDSATAQFFINVVDNQRLDHVDEGRYGYAVFGEVTEGMDVVDKIRDVPTMTKGEYENVPAIPVMIKSIRLVGSAKPAKADKKTKGKK